MMYYIPIVFLLYVLDSLHVEKHLGIGKSKLENIINEWKIVEKIFIIRLKSRIPMMRLFMV